MRKWGAISNGRPYSFVPLDELSLASIVSPRESRARGMDSSTGAGCWVCILTKPNSERIAADNLIRQKFEIFLPRIKMRKIVRKRFVATSVPLFPRYAFVFIYDQWRVLMNTIGVSGVILDGERPAKVPESIIRSIRARLGSDGYIAMDEAPKFQPGQSIKVLGSAFDGQTGIFQAKNGDDRVKILLNLLGAKVAVDLDERNIVAA